MLVQLIANGISAGASIALVAFGFGLIYATTRFFHFAHGFVFAWAAYSLLLARQVLGLPVPVSILLAVASAALCGVAIELAVYRPLRRQRVGALGLLLASLGVYVVGQNSLSLLFGDATRSVRTGAVSVGFEIAGARVTAIQLTTVCVAVIALLVIALVLQRTRMGRALRAVANDPELAEVVGINRQRTYVQVFAIGSALAGIGAVLVAYDVDMTPTMGMNALMMSVIAIIVGGIGSLYGAALGGLMLGLVLHLGVWRIPTQWQDTIAFALLLLFLVVRPHGLLGRPLRKATV